MDEAARADLRIRFIKLIVLLNAILILIAVAVLLHFKVPPPAETVGVAVLLAAAIALFLFFLRMYRETRQWLEDEQEKKVRESSDDTGSGPAETGEQSG